ncbi:MAG: EAL domain-containing protein [Pseudomonadota bacterium]
MSGLLELLMHPALAAGLSLGALLGLVLRPILWPSGSQDVNADVLRRENEKLVRNTRAPVMVAGHSPDGLLIQDMRGRIEWANAAFTEITGWPIEDVIGRRPQEFLLPPELRPAPRDIARFRYDPSSAYFDGFHTVQHVTREGERFWSQLGFALVESPDREEEGRVVVSIRDVTDQMEELAAAQAVSGEWATMRAALDAAHDGVLLQSMTGEVEWASPAILRLTGYGIEELRGRNPDSILPMPEKRLGKAALAAFRFDPASTAFRRNRVEQIVLRNGGTAWAEIRHFRFEAQEGAGERSERVVSIWRDVTSIVRREQELHGLKTEMERLTRTDAVTGLSNRARFAEYLGDALTRAAGMNSRTAAIHVDLERFKEVNDTLGLAAGDAVLCEIANRLTGWADGQGLVARSSGDEFLVVCEDVESGARVVDRANDLGDALRAQIDWRGCRIRLGARIGIALSEPGQYQASRLLQQADIALTHLRGSRASVRLYTEDLGRQHFDRQSLLSDLALAATRAQFEVHYQPQVDLETGRVTALEALLRWRHPDHGVLAPGDFFSLAAEAGIMEDIDHAAMQAGLSALTRLREAVGQTTRLSLNVAVATLIETDYLSALAEALAKNALTPADVVLELGRLSQVNDRDTELLDRIVDAGFTVMLDEFGMGSAGLGALSSLPVSGVKIDGRVTRGMAAGDRQALTLRAILTLCHDLGLEAVVAGLSESQQIPVLRAMGVTQAQGYAIAMPMQAAELSDWAQAQVRPQEPRA